MPRETTTVAGLYFVAHERGEGGGVQQTWYYDQHSDRQMSFL